jgi:hypothetical protein
MENGAREKTMTVTVSISTNPATAHIGRYFVDMRDTTHNPDPVTAKQLRTEVHTEGGVLDLISQLKGLAAKNDVRLIVRNRTNDEIAL